MIDYNKSTTSSYQKFSTNQKIKKIGHLRVSKKKLTAANKYFLKSIGLLK